MVEHKIKINSMTEFNLGDELILNDKLLESRKEYIVIKKEITLNDMGIDYTLQEKQDYLFGCEVVVSNSVEPGKFKLVNEEPLVQASKCKRVFTNIKNIPVRVKSSDKNNDFERIRCVCGCYMQVDYGTDENSNEYFEAYCSRCGKERSGTL